MANIGVLVINYLWMLTNFTEGAVSTLRRRVARALPVTVLTALAAAAGTAVCASEAEAAPADYELEYIEDLPVLGARQSVSPDGEWIYYSKPVDYTGVYTAGNCGLHTGTDSGGNPLCGVDRVFRVRPDGTGEECLTCNVFASNGRPLWVSSPVVRPEHEDFLLVVVEKETHDSVPGGDSCSSGGSFSWWFSDLAVLPIDGNGDVDEDSLIRLFEVSGDVDDLGWTQDPRWSRNGQFIVWVDYLPNWLARMRTAAFIESDGSDSTPHLHGADWNGTFDVFAASSHGTSPAVQDPSGPTNAYVVNSFTLDATGAISGLMYASSPEGQYWFHNDLAVYGFETETETRLTQTSGTGSEPAQYEEHAKLNERYWDVIAYMTGPGPDPSFACFYDGFAPYDDWTGTPEAPPSLAALETDLWLMSPNGSNKNQITHYNDIPGWSMDPDANPSTCRPEEDWEGAGETRCRVVISRLWWAPNGVDLVVSFGRIIDEDANDDPSDGFGYQFDGGLKLFHFSRAVGQSPSTNAAHTGNGFEQNPERAYFDETATSSSYASNVNGYGDRHVYGGFGLSFPMSDVIHEDATIVIDGVEVTADWWVDALGGTGPYLAVDLSWDGGSTWTSGAGVGLKATGTPSTSEVRHTLGSSSDTWGRTWVVDDTTNHFSDDNFKVRITSFCVLPACAGVRDYFLDWVGVKVHYHVE